MQTIKIPFLRGTTAQNDAYRGSEGEITIDTQARSLRIHDGVQLGGEALLRRRDLDQFVAGTTVYDRRSSVASSTVVYRGEALPGTADTMPGWRIKKVTVVYGSTITVQETWANGLQTFAHKWADRATYSYTL